MTIQEINALIVSDVEIELKGRVYSKYLEGLTDEEEAVIYEDFTFTQEQLEEELVLYKAELTVIENERLRLQDLKDRWENMVDVMPAFIRAVPNTPNPAAYFRDSILSESNKSVAESRLAAIEAEYSAVTIEMEAVAQEEMLKDIVRNAMEFGNKILVEFASENIQLGITQAGMTKQVRVAMQEVMNALMSGSLYDAISEIKEIQFRDPTFVTDIRLLIYVNKIESYLGISLSEDLGE